MFAILSPPEDLPEPDLFPQGCGDLMWYVQKQLGKAFWQKDRNWASGIFGPCFCREPSGRRNVWRQCFPHHIPHLGVPAVLSMIQPWTQLLSNFSHIIPAGVTALHIGKIDHTFVHSAAAGLQGWISRFGHCEREIFGVWLLLLAVVMKNKKSFHAAVTLFEALWCAWNFAQVLAVGGTVSFASSVCCWDWIVYEQLLSVWFQVLVGASEHS